MFRINPSIPPNALASVPRRSEQSAFDETMEDVLMAEDVDAEGPTRAAAVGSGRVTGPGEAIADSGRWMR